MNSKNADICSYEDIINLPHHMSSKHPPMEILTRAAQFAPFSALSGYEEAVNETARLTDEKIELDENAKAELDEKLRIVKETLPEHPFVTITYFRPDERKPGGAYDQVSGRIKKIDEFQRAVIMTSGLYIPFKDVLDIEGEIFGKLL